MAKEKSINPAQAQRKLEKQKALKKGKAEQAARRTEKLARRNPERLQRQLDDLRALEKNGQPLNHRDRKAIEELERDVAAVRKARETLGDSAPAFGSGGRGGAAGRERGGASSALGKRRRGDEGGWRHGRGNHGNEEEESDDSATESVKNIPMPRDTPPPIPPHYLRQRDGNRGNASAGANANPNLEPLPSDRIRRMGGGAPSTEPTGPHGLPPRPGSAPDDSPPEHQEQQQQQAAQIVYEAKPIVRDLRKEAVRAFVPGAVRLKLEAARGKGKLLEPEELERLEAEGYGGTRGGGDGNGDGTGREEGGDKNGKGEGGGGGKEGPDEATQRRLAEEERRFELEMRNVQMEEVEDEDG